MAMTLAAPTSPVIGLLPTLLRFLRSSYSNLIAARQKQADARVATYLHDLSSLYHLGLPPEVLNKLRHPRTSRSNVTRCVE